MRDNSTSVLNIQQPMPSIEFDGVGRLHWDGKRFNFDGNATDSAKLFLGECNRLFPEYLESKAKVRELEEELQAKKAEFIRMENAWRKNDKGVRECHYREMQALKGGNN